MEHVDILFTNMSHFERINFTTGITVTGTYILKILITQCQETIFVRKIERVFGKVLATTKIPYPSKLWIEFIRHALLILTHLLTRTQTSERSLIKPLQFRSITCFGEQF